MDNRSERGAVAVEFAFVLPILLMLVIGIAEFGRGYNTQIALTHAARESVRIMAITNNPEAAKNAAVNTAVSLNPKLMPADITLSTTPASSPVACKPGSTTTVVIHYTLHTVTGLMGPIDMTGKGVMLCGG